MSWLKKLTNRESRSQSTQQQGTDITGKLPKGTQDVSQVCLDVFKSYWYQVNGVIDATLPNASFKDGGGAIYNITSDDVDTVRNLLEQMIFLLAEEQCSGQLMGPILEFAITENVFEKLYFWWEHSASFKKEILLNLLKIYEVLISQAQYSLLHHKQLVGPMLKLLSSSDGPRTEELDHHIVLLLNLLCVWINRDATLLEVFFGASQNHGPTKFLLFSLLIDYIHRDGTVGQQARDALLLCMALSSENESVAEYIVETSNFCPVLATGLSGLYSTLPRHMEVRADDWHCLHRSDWSNIVELSKFMNSFEFCNSVIEVAHHTVSEQLLEFMYNGFLVSVFGPSLHKTSVDEVVVTTAYLNMFLRSVTAPALMRCFLKFLLTHRHESSLIVNTLIQRIASNNRLALVSLSLIRTLVDLNCEDLMLQLVFSHLLPCQHILASQRRAIRDVDLYNASASRFLALTPTACTQSGRHVGSEAEILKPVSQELDGTQHSKDGSNPLNVEPQYHGNHDNHKHATGNHASQYSVNEDLSLTINLHAASPETNEQIITSPSTMAEFGPDLKSQLELNTSYMDYLEDARHSIAQCRVACHGWSAMYDGDNNHADVITFQQAGAVKCSSLKKGSNDPESDPAMKALSATYQAINLTVRAFNGDTNVGLASQGDYDENFNKHGKIEIKSTTDVQSTTSTNVPSTTSTDLSSTKSTDFPSTESTNVPSTKSTDVPSTKSTDLPSTKSTDLPSTKSTDVPSTKSTDVPSTKSTDVPSTKSTDVPSTKSTDLPSTKSTDLPSTKSTDLPLTTSTDAPSTTSTDLPSTTSTNAPSTTSTNAPSTTSTDAPSTTSTDAPSTTSTDPPSTTTVKSLSHSTVDEFFRSLMEIVPKTKVERKGLFKLDEDIESGIELSSDGDFPQGANEVLSDGDFPQNGNEVCPHSSDIDETTHEEVLSQTSSDTDELESLGTIATYRFMDTDDEFDDSASMTSSFYEVCDEYSPTVLSISPATPLKLHGLPYTGPLIGTLFAKLDQMISNSLYENLLLTGIISRLASYPQPLLRSFLLNTQMVFHPSVRSLYQVLNSARNKIDVYTAEVPDFTVLVRRAQKFLLARGTLPLSGDARTRNVIRDKPMPVPRVKTKTFGDMFARKKPDRNKSSLLPKLETLLERRDRKAGVKSPTDRSKESGSMFYVKERLQERDERKLRELKTKNAVYACIVLTEFLKELAAIAQEHAVSDITV